LQVIACARSTVVAIVIVSKFAFVATDIVGRSTIDGISAVAASTQHLLVDAFQHFEVFDLDPVVEVGQREVGAADVDQGVGVVTAVHNVVFGFTTLDLNPVVTGIAVDRVRAATAVERIVAQKAV
jgi:hypothetical protein